MPRALQMSLKARLLLIHTGIWLVGFAMAGVLILNHERAAVRVESASNLELVQDLLRPVLPNASASPSTKVFDEILEAVARVRHVQVVREPHGTNPTPRLTAVSSVPKWFTSLVAPPPNTLPRIVLPRSIGLPALIIEADPADEIREAWEEVRTFLTIAGGVFILVCTMIYFVLRQSLNPLAQLLVAFQGLEHDDFSTRVSEKAVPELARIHREFNRMAEILGAAVQRNRWLAGSLVSVQEDERRHFARELHDEMGPALFDITVRATAIRNSVERDAFAEIPAQLRVIESTVGEVQKRLREILRRLRPLVLDEFGLQQALEDLIANWQSRCPEIKWSIETRGLTDELNDTLRVSIYRIVQECLTNVARHAAAYTASVVLEVVPHNTVKSGADRINVRIEDDGVGIGPGTRFGLGLTGIQERVQALGGALNLEPRDPQGVCVNVWIPKRREHQDDSDPGDEVSTAVAVAKP